MKRSVTKRIRQHTELVNSLHCHICKCHKCVLENPIDGFQSHDKRAMLVHRTIANYAKNSQDFLPFVLCANMVLVTSGENHPMINFFAGHHKNLFKAQLS